MSHKSVRYETKPKVCERCRGIGTTEDKKGREVKCPSCIDGYNYNKIIKYDRDRRYKLINDILGLENIE